ncbi:hypothetical protein GmHk_18G053386 [Glycine max]|uniref:Uncharacterized protein n=1 Tax=Glycine max TaxID=3847 RepID=K7MV44_SOYBN|nr:hypothetical protein GYH30_051319 [Glycine max]KAH1200212.1 hypothetical protein GmHk_18G053386 [Glycine max]
MSLIQPKTCDCLAVAFVSNLCKVGSHNQPMPCHCNNALIASSCHLCNYVKALPSFQRSIPHSFCIAFGSIDTCMLESLLEAQYNFCIRNQQEKFQLRTQHSCSSVLPSLVLLLHPL